MVNSNQPAVPLGLTKGDRVFWENSIIHLRGEDETVILSGIILDILSSQFLVEDDNGRTRLVRFDKVRKSEAT